MDYSGIINLALVTIIYSTFIAPNLKKLGEIKDGIVNVEFPTGEGVDGEIVEAGLEIEKKTTQYALKYYELKKFIRFFYVIIILLFAFEVFSMYASNSFTSGRISYLVLSIAIIIILVSTLNSFMTQPWVVRSIKWLVELGVSPFHYQKMHNPKIVINSQAINWRRTPMTTVSIVSSMDLRGYSIISTVESTDGDELYFLSAGPIGKYLIGGTAMSEDGTKESFNEIVKTRLKEGTYNLRVLMFDAPLDGEFSAHEVVVKFKTSDKSLSEAIDLTQDSNYTYTSKGRVIKNVDFRKTSSKGHKVLKMTLGSRRFLKRFYSSKRIFYLANKNGLIDRYDIESSMGRFNVAIAHVRRIKIRGFGIKKYLNLKPILKR